MPLTAAVATDTASVAAPADGITAALIGQHTQVLASDAFQGRRPFTAGEEKATGYLVAEFKKLGLQPGPGGSYLQSMPLVEITGTPAPTATAKGFRQAHQKPARSIVFLAFTAEESGLLGSGNYAAHPLFQLALTVANLNSEGLLDLGPMRDFTIIGYGQSELDDYVRAAAREQNRYVIAFQHPESGIFYRSDHFSFAQVGVPALYADGEYDSRLRGKAFVEEKYNKYYAKHNHQPSNEYDPKADLRGTEQDMRLLFRVGQKLASETTFPKWKEGSEFKAIRKKSRPNQ